jgi:hypothetical protein
MQEQVKKTIVSRFIDHYSYNKDLVHSHQMKAGDLALFEVISIGKHETAQMADGRNRSIFPGDYIVATFADRYATSQFEGYVPTSPQESYDILGAGGAIGIVKSKNAAFKDIEPTKVKLIAYCCDETGSVINTKFYNQNRIPFRGNVKPKVILSIGSTMDSGKTTTAAFVTRGLMMGGHKVGFIKLTGTCYTKDREFVYDCGAHIVKDFSDVGYPSTYMCSKAEILDIYQTIIDSLASDNLEYIVVEIADGLMQRETMFLLKDSQFMQTINQVVFSCGDSLSAFYGVQLLREWGIHTTAISGRFTMSPLLIEEVQQVISTPIFKIDEVMTGELNALFNAQVPQLTT